MNYNVTKLKIKKVLILYVEEVISKMKKNNLKKMIGGIVLSLMVVFGGSAPIVQASEAVNIDDVASLEKIDSGYFYSEYEEQFGYSPYGSVNGQVYYQSEQDIKDLVSEGVLTPEEGNLEIQFLNATSDEEKDEIYRKIIDETRSLYDFTDSEIQRLKDEGYKNYNKVLDEFYYDRSVDSGIMTRGMADAKLKYNSASNEEERQAAYGLIIDEMVKDGTLTNEQGSRLKSGGYKNHGENMSIITFEEMVDELLGAGVLTQDKASDLKARVSSDDAWNELYDKYDRYIITQELVDASIITNEKAKEIRSNDSEDSLDELYNLYGRYIIEDLVESGYMTREEADLQLRILDATTEESLGAAYNDLLEYEVKSGFITQEEADAEREAMKI